FLGFWPGRRAVLVEQQSDLLIHARLRRDERLDLRGAFALQFRHSSKYFVDSLEPAIERGKITVDLSIRRHRDLCQLLDGYCDLLEAVLDAREPERMPKLRACKPVYGFFDGHFTAYVVLRGRLSFSYINEAHFLKIVGENRQEHSSQCQLHLRD